MPRSQPQPLLIARNVARSFTEGDRVVHAIRDLSLRVEPGTMTALVGPDGAGKTTFLRIASGLLRIDSGQVEVLGHDVSVDAATIQEKVGYMPQRFGLYEDLSVVENLDLYAEINGVGVDDRGRLYERLLRMTALGPFRTRLAGRLSGGMKQKLGLACTLVRSPQLLLLDEPTVGVDPLSRRELWSIIRYLVTAESMTVLLSTSHMDEAASCDRVIVIREGRSIFDGRPSEVAEKARGRSFIATPAPGVSARAFQARLYERPGIVDAVPSGGQVRYVTALPYPEVPGSAPTFEDGFMTLFRADHPDRETASGAVSGAASVTNAAPAHSATPAPADFPDSPRPAAAPSQNVMVKTSDLVRRFGSFTAVDRVSFAVAEGTVFGLLGPNGAGKTTTFRMLCGLLSATSGTLEVAGHDLRAAGPRARRQIGYMAQKFSLYGPLSVSENLAFFARAYGLRAARKQARIDWAVAEFGLGPFLRQPAAQLPGGIRQRLSLAAALLHEPRILFLDEPTSGADPVARREFWVRINALAETGVTVVVTTHFMEEAEYCDRLVVLDGGRVIAAGTPAEIRAAAGRSEAAELNMEEAFVAIVEARRSAAANGEAGGSGATARGREAVDLPNDQGARGSASEDTDGDAGIDSGPAGSQRKLNLADLLLERARGLGSARTLRILALIRKESLQLVRDPSTIAIGIVMPLMLVLLFGYGLSLDVRDIPMALVIQDSSSEAQDLAARFELSPYFDTRRASTMQVAEQLMLSHDVRAILHLTSDFSRNLTIGEIPQVQLLVNGTEANTARIVESYARSTLLELGSIRGAEDPLSIRLPVRLERRLWFNAANESRFFLVPGLIVLVMTLLGAFMTALVMAREWERGTFEALFVTPVRASEILTGKLVPYFLLGLFGLALSVIGSKLLFGVPFRGSWFVLLLVSALYLIVALSIGLVASSLTKSQFVASQIALIVTFLPAVMLSGFLFDLNSMPAAVEAVTYVLPARYYVALLQTLFLAGNVWQVIVPNMAVLFAMALLMLAAAAAVTRKSLD